MLYLRQVKGQSMFPALKPGMIVLVRSGGKLSRGDVIVITHEGIEKIKRLIAVRPSGLYVRGDNPDASIDSRHFGWVEPDLLKGKVIWPKI